MTQWLKPNTRFACKLAQTACISALLAAALSGCNEDKAPVSGSTFDPVATKAVVETPKLDPKDEPVKGTVTVGKPAGDPVTTGGLATPLPAKVGRFTEIAPDTAGGATFRSSPEMHYDLGNLVASNAFGLASSKDDKALIVPIQGWVRYPQEALSKQAPTRFPVIVFEHGNHDLIDPSYKGYDYLAEELASHGYVVVSLDGTFVNYMAGAGDGDWSGQARAQLILGTLDRLREIDKKGQEGALNVLKGKLDFTRIGIMGHSRGGQGVSNAIKYNQTRVSVHEADLKDVAIEYSAIIKAISAEDLAFAATERLDDEYWGKFGYDSTKISAILLYRSYKDLLNAVIPASTQPAVEPKPETIVPAGIDEEKFRAAYDKYQFALPDVESTKAILSANPSVYAQFFPELAAAFKPAMTIPAVEAKAARIVPASIDDAKFTEAVKKYNIFYAATRETIAPYDFKAAFMLAPMDNNNNLGVNNVPLANLLPTCDGDVSGLYGARSFDHNRIGPVTDMAPRYQIQVFGANHNFYNTEWRDDDSSTSGTGYCSASRPGSIRLNRVDQRRGGSFLINSFMRYHVGGEQKFAAYWNGTAQLPNAACPSTDGPCDERIILTVQKDATRRKLIARFERDDSTDRNELGGTLSLNGFTGSARCDMPIGGDYSASGICTPARLDAFDLLSIADHLQLAWSAPNASVVTDLRGLSARGMDSLTFRIGVVRPMGQEVLVTLTDGASRTATLTASDFSNALYNAPRAKADGRPLVDHPDDAAFAYQGEVKILMNMVAIPLAAFEGVDTNNLKELKLVFPKE
ncbi:alpha/beta hydrolase family protein, partial [Phyllobacterium endophyticum]